MTIKQRLNNPKLQRLEKLFFKHKYAISPKSKTRLKIARMKDNLFFQKTC